MNDENDWEECKDSNTALSVTPDHQKAQALKKTAEGRTIFLDKHDITEENANYLFEGYYASALEVIHAHLASKGWNVKNHLCIAHYLRDELKKADLNNIFNDCRRKRNKLQYYGKTMDKTTATKAIEQCKQLIKAIL